MNARVNDYRVLWRAALSHSSAFDSGIVRWGGLFIAIAIGAPVWYVQGLGATMVLAWCMAWGVVLVTWTWRFIPGALKLNSPANAKLVPGVRRRLVELACLVWFVAMAGIALTAYASNGTVGMWLLWIMLCTVGSALSAAGHQAGGAMILVACVGAVFLGDLSESAHATLSPPSIVALVLLACGGLIAVAVRAIFPEGGDRHWRMIERRVRIIAEPGKPDPMLQALAGAQSRGWYAASLRRDCARRDSRRLVLHGLGPAHHFGELLLGLGLFAGVLLVLAIFTTWRTGGEAVRDIGWLFASTLMFLPVATTLRLNELVGAYPDEQALVRLAPAMPGAQAPFNHHLGRSLLLQAFMGWALATGTALLLAALGGADAATLARVASICCLALPIMEAPLRNHALRAPSTVLGPLVLLGASIGASIAFGFALRAVSGLPAMPVAAVASLAIAAVAVMRGLRIMDASPFAFPARRMD